MTDQHVLRVLRICYLLIVTILLMVIPALADGEDVGDYLNLQTGGLAKTLVRLEINGQMLASTDYAQIIDGRSMVPLKTITESFGIPVSWFDSSQIIRIDDENGPIFLKIGDSKAQVSGQAVVLDMPPMIEGGQTLVPLRFMADALQAQIEWLPEQNLIKLIRSTLGPTAYENYQGKTRVIFDLTAPEEYKIFQLHNPERLVIDFLGARYAEKKTTQLVEGGLISAVRVSQFQLEPLVARAVMDLNHPDIEYQVHVLTAQKKLVVDITRKLVVDEAMPTPDEDQIGRPIAPLPQPEINSLQNKIIVIDPGHGGKNPGAIGVTGVWESDVNYDIAVRLNELLQGTGAFTIMTRKPSEDPGLYERAAISNDNRADIFVSIHADAHPKPETRGSTVYAHHNASETNWALAWYVHNEIIKSTGLQSKGLRAANFVVVREPVAPAILIESAYLTNKEDEALLKDPNFRQKIAQGIYNGIMIYFSQSK